MARLPRFARGTCVLTVEGAGAGELNGEYVKLGPKTFHQRSGTGKIWQPGSRRTWLMGDSGRQTPTFMVDSGLDVAEEDDEPPSSGWSSANGTGGSPPTLRRRGNAVEGAHLAAALRRLRSGSTSSAGAWQPEQHGAVLERLEEALQAARKPGARRAELLEDLAEAIQNVKASLHKSGVSLSKLMEQGEEQYYDKDPSRSETRPHRILLICWGSRGDVQPFCALGKALVQRGHQVCCAAPDGNEHLVSSFGMGYVCSSMACSWRMLVHWLPYLVVKEAIRSLLLHPLAAYVWPVGIPLPVFVQVCIFGMICAALLGAVFPLICSRLSFFTTLPFPRLPVASSISAEMTALFFSSLARQIPVPGVREAVCVLQDMFVFFICGLRGLSFLATQDAEKFWWMAVHTTRLGALARELERCKPDVIVCQLECIRDVGLALSTRYKIPVIFAGIQAEGLAAHTPLLQWEACYAESVKREELLFEPTLGTTGIKDMGCDGFRELLTKHALFALPTFLPQDAGFQQICGHSHILNGSVLTGAWIVDEEQEHSVADFGGAVVRDKLEGFLSEGGKPKPFYLGWGSMTSSRGAAYLCRLAVGALKSADARGIILGGWSALSPDLLKGSDPETVALQAYAKEHVLFVDKAPHNWLLPRCSGAVIHGGISTLLTCWRAGVPSIVCPILGDQFFNGIMNMTLGSGYITKHTDQCSAQELGNLISSVAAGADFANRVAELRGHMTKDSGASTAAAHIEAFMLAYDC